ncbi:MAG: glycosyltransferase family 39 protein [Anaerolineales bacterium]|nr:glycosyltransferase family 39 protein [Anaerolineales bacterium]
MTPTPSVLDWLKYKLGQPRAQRWLRFGLAALFAVVGVLALVGAVTPSLGAVLVLAVAVGLFFWGLSVRGANAPAAEMPGLTLPAARPAPAAAPAEDAPARAALFDREQLIKLMAGARLPSALVLTVAGQSLLLADPPKVAAGVTLLAAGVALFAVVVWYDHLLGTARPVETEAESKLDFRWWLLGAALVLGAYGFYAAGDNTYRWGGVIAWVLSLAAWMAALWDWRTPPAEMARRSLARLGALAETKGLAIPLSRVALVFLIVLGIGAYFRFAQLDAIPPEMTSDHVEKLFDVNDVLNGRHPVFFERNTGREPLQFYFAALLIELFHTGVTHLTLKLTGAIAGLVMLPFMFLIGKELEDTEFGLWAMLLAGMSFWAVAISRVGLRFPLTPLFVAPMLWFLLRALRRNSRNDFLLAGLTLGLGLYGYSTIRLVPLVIVLAVVIWLIWSPPGRSRRQLIANTILLFATTFFTFLPLYRYAISPDNIFWYRSFSRLTGEEQAINGSVIQIFLENNWNALRMFNYLGDQVWVNTLPGKPSLDYITGALFLFGVAFALGRVVFRRDRVALFLLLALPVLLLPSTLSVAFPNENPSVVRAGGAIPVVFTLTAYPLWLLWKRLRAVWPGLRGLWARRLIFGAMVTAVFVVNSDMYFRQYPRQYLGGAENASEIGAVVRDFAQSIGSYDRAWMCLHPYWADTRAVGIYAGQVGWEQVLPPDQLGQLAGDPRPLLIVMHPQGQDCIAAARQLFPTGTLTLRHSARDPNHDYLLFFVPGTEDLDETTLPQP